MSRTGWLGELLFAELSAGTSLLTISLSTSLELLLRELFFFLVRLRGGVNLRYHGFLDERYLRTCRNHRRADLDHVLGC